MSSRTYEEVCEEMDETMVKILELWNVTRTTTVQVEESVEAVSM